MNKLRVKLTQVMHKFTKPKYTAVGGVEIALTQGGSGTSAVTSSWQAATLELVEVAGASDKTTTERVLVKIPGFIQEANKAPFFTTGNRDTAQANLNSTSETVMFGKADSDFSLELTWDATTLQIPTVYFVRFPWESSEEDQQQELRARLTIGTTVEADLKDNDKVDIPMKHLDVPEDGAAGGALSDCFGFGTVYPVKNNNMKPTETVPFTGKTMNVFVHKDIGAAVNAVVPSGYDFGKLTTALKDILASGGFTNVSVVEVDWTDSRLTAIGTVSGTAGNQTFTPGPNGIPYFDSWLLLDKATTWKAGMEAGQSEAATYQISKATKVLTSPIMILNGALANFIPMVDKAKIHIFLANLFAHEIGHGLGLNHGLDATVTKGPPTSCAYSKATGTGTMTDVKISGNSVFLQRFGPVHRDALKKHYVL